MWFRKMGSGTVKTSMTVRIPQEKIARIAYIPERQWIIGVGSYIDEFYAAVSRIEAVQARSLISMGIILCVVLLLSITGAFLFSNSFIRRIGHEEFSTRVHQASDNAVTTEHIALKVAQMAQEGGQAVHDTVQAMRMIAEG